MYGVFVISAFVLMVVWILRQSMLERNVDKWNARKEKHRPLARYFLNDIRAVRYQLWLTAHRKERKREVEESQARMDEELRRIFDGRS